MMHFKAASVKLISLSVLAAAICVLPQACAQQPVPWTRSDLIAPSALRAMLRSGKKPLILQVGFRVLYEGGHIPGAEYCGPARDAKGLDRLRECVAHIPHARLMVIYCGCCPLQECPNVRPAYALLRRLGYTHVKILDLPTSFQSDWIEKGYPIVRSSPAPR